MDTANKKILLFANKGITWSFYLAFVMLLLFLSVEHNPDLPRTVLTCGISFLAVSLFRRIYNAPRPYEKDGVAPLTAKKTQGRSFPSRHVFSAFVIAVSVFFFYPSWGIALLCLGVLLAYLRTALKVHYVKDVVAGALCGIASGIIGFWLIP
ncbi:MAG TPA: phosphatase PAP2 family protein [Clostridiales bacterium]|nr:phosphatase PAP2 family protein [Clostridiales bacterium]